MKLPKLLKKKSWRIVLMFVAVALLMIWIGLPAPEQTPDPQTQTVNSIDSFEIINETNPTFQDMGHISIIETGDSILTLFTTGDGTTYQIMSNPPLEYRKYDGDYVNIWGTVSKNNAAMPQLYVASVVTLRDAAAVAATEAIDSYYEYDTGFIGFIYADRESGEAHDIVDVFFTNSEGEMFEVGNSDPAQFFQYNGDYVSIRYSDMEDISQIVLSDEEFGDDAILIREVEVIQDSLETAVTGNTRWVNIACRFGDMKDTTPKPIDYFEDMMVNIAPGMDHYWRATSANLVNIEGSGAFGWYDLPDTKAVYTRAAALNTGNALRKLMNDCVKEAIQNDNVDFTQYGGINMMLNDTFGCCAWGGRMGVDVNGKTIQFRTTWLPPWAYDSLHVIAHEMGHGWGLPHSSGPYGKVYDSAWDVMSGGNTNHTDAICRVGDEKLGCYQVGTIGFHLATLGWVPEGRMATVNKGDTVMVTLDALTTIADSQNLLTVFIPTGSGNTFYTVDVRTFFDYDRNLPGEAIVLHEVVPTRSSPAHVVDGDNNGNPNDEGAMWLPGETFEDKQNNIKVEVLSRDENTFEVRITNGN